MLLSHHFCNTKRNSEKFQSCCLAQHTLENNFNPLTPNDKYSGRTATLTSKRCILYIYSPNIGTEYFKHSIYNPFFPLQNAVCFIILTNSVHVLFTFYIQGVLKLKKIIPAPKVNPLTPNDHYSSRTAPLTSKRCILYIYSSNTGTRCFKHGIYSSFLFLFKMLFAS